jgi:hypothetical protein
MQLQGRNTSEQSCDGASPATSTYLSNRCLLQNLQPVALMVTKMAVVVRLATPGVIGDADKVPTSTTQ